MNLKLFTFALILCISKLVNAGDGDKYKVKVFGFQKYGLEAEEIQNGSDKEMKFTWEKEDDFFAAWGVVQAYKNDPKNVLLSKHFGSKEFYLTGVSLNSFPALVTLTETRKSCKEFTVPFSDMEPLVRRHG